jgi:predicted choloylglycine hydrolase
MPTRFRAIPAAFLVLIALAGCSQAAKAPAADPSDPIPFPIVQLHGTPTQLGQSQGEQLGPQLRDLYSRYFNAYFHSEFQRQLALLAASVFETHVPADYRTEIHALAKSANLAERHVMLEQCFLDLSATTACSTFTVPAAGCADHVARFGRDLDWPGLDIADKSSVLLIFHPEGRYAFASVAWPGMIGVLSGMNEYGLTLCNMEVPRPERPPTAMPYSLLYRTILERCKTVDEAIELLKTTPRQTANNLMLMDAAGHRAVAEIKPDKVTIRRAPPTQVLISTNHQRGKDLNTPGRCDRYDYLDAEGAREFGRITLASMQTMLQHVSQPGLTLQSMIFEPASRVIYLAVGADAAHKKLTRIDLKPMFAN